MLYGQVVLGSAGSGKTTYCVGMHQFLTLSGRSATVVNLDPANDMDAVLYPCAIDIRNLVDVWSVSEKEQLGPNGALLWALEHALKNVDWLIGGISDLKLQESSYVLFDCPGQIEVYCGSKIMSKIIDKIQESLSIKFVVINLIDSIQCTGMPSFIAAMCVSLSIMVSLDYPFLTVLSKADLRDFKSLPASVDTYTSCINLVHYVRLYSQRIKIQFFETLAEHIENNGILVCSFLDIQDKHSVSKLLERIECANGH